jgi:hypothetical protein
MPILGAGGQLAVFPMCKPARPAGMNTKETRRSGRSAPVDAAALIRRCACDLWQLLQAGADGLSLRHGNSTLTNLSNLGFVERVAPLDKERSVYAIPRLARSVVESFPLAQRERQIGSRSTGSHQKRHRCWISLRCLSPTPASLRIPGWTAPFMTRLTGSSVRSYSDESAIRAHHARG